MIRSPAFLRSVSRLALLAVLLMAFAPSVSRVLAGAGTQVLAGWAELCTAQGLKWVDTATPSTAEKSPLPAPTPAPMPMGDDCAYCPLAASLPPLLPLFFVPHPRPAAGGIPPADPAPRRMAANLRGLGGQGPPVLL